MVIELLLCVGGFLRDWSSTDIQIVSTPLSFQYNFPDYSNESHWYLLRLDGSPLIVRHLELFKDIHRERKGGDKKKQCLQVNFFYAEDVYLACPLFTHREGHDPALSDWERRLRSFSGACNFLDRPQVCQSLANYSIEKYRWIEIRDDHGEFRNFSAPDKVMVNIEMRGVLRWYWSHSWCRRMASSGSWDKL